MSAGDFDGHAPGKREMTVRLGGEYRTVHGLNRAILLDRDGTLVYPRHYPTRPEQLRLYPGIAAPLRRLQAHGFRLAVITNQSGIAHGLLTETELNGMHQHLTTELATLGVRLDGIYHCPHHPEGIVTRLAVRCGCRKPEPGMLLQAAADLRLDLARCWLIGDILDDMEAGNRVGCRTVLVDIGTEPLPPTQLRAPAFVARDTPHALRVIMGMEGLAPVPDLSYQPPRWRADVVTTRAERTSHPTELGGANGLSG